MVLDWEGVFEGDAFGCVGVVPGAVERGTGVVGLAEGIDADGTAFVGDGRVVEVEDCAVEGREL